MVGINFLLLLCPLSCLPPPLPSPPSFPPSIPLSVRPEGTLLAGDPLSPSLSPSVKLRGVKLEPRPIQQVSWRTHTHRQKSSPFAKFSIIRVPPWFVPHHTPLPASSPSSLSLLPLPSCWICPLSIFSPYHLLSLSSSSFIPLSFAFVPSSPSVPCYLYLLLLYYSPFLFQSSTLPCLVPTSQHTLPLLSNSYFLPGSLLIKCLSTFSSLPALLSHYLHSPTTSVCTI